MHPYVKLMIIMYGTIYQIYQYVAYFFQALNKQIESNQGIIMV